VNMLTIIDNV